MQVGWTEDQTQFRDVVGKFLSDKSPPTAVRELMASDVGYDADVWRQLCQEVGLAGTHLPEAYGGFGFGPIELGIVAEQMGRHLYCGPYFASAVMASYAILDAATEAHKQRLLPDIAQGLRIATLVLDDVSAAEHVGQNIRANNEVLNGSAGLVLDAHIADLLVVVAATDAGLGLFEVDAKNVTIKALTSLDPTRKLSSVTFNACPATLLGDNVAIQKLWDQLSTALAHEMIGGAQHLFETTIDYMKMRVQFGRAIGSFQALKHRCADLLLELEMAKAMTYAAARYLSSGEGDAYAPNMAKALASDAYISIAKQAIQLRGGIGFTWEEDTHLWFKRAKSSEVFLGSSNWHREHMIQRLEQEAAHV